MTISGYSKVGNVNSSEPIKIDLKIMDYVFCYNNEDLSNAKLKYWFDKIQNIEFKYENGKKIWSKENFSPTIDFSISAEDRNKERYYFNFMLNLDLKILNKMSTTIPTNINNYVIEGEILLDNPYIEGVEFLDIEKEENIYHFTPSYWVQKLEKNKFAFKIQYQSLFIWFHINFDEK